MARDFQPTLLSVRGARGDWLYLGVEATARLSRTLAYDLRRQECPG